MPPTCSELYNYFNIGWMLAKSQLVHKIPSPYHTNVLLYIPIQTSHWKLLSSLLYATHAILFSTLVKAWSSPSDIISLVVNGSTHSRELVRFQFGEFYF